MPTTAIPWSSSAACTCSVRTAWSGSCARRATRSNGSARRAHVDPDSRPAGVNDPLRWYSDALDAFERHEWTRARDLAERVAALAPRHAGVRYLAGVAALQMGQV